MTAVLQAPCSHGPDSRHLLQIRTQLAKEMTQDLSDVAEENALLMRETIAASFSLDNVVRHPFGDDA